jgi:hypothetical protein
MHDTQAPRPRLNIVSRAARTKRIFARMREGWAYDEIARDEGLSAERVRQIVAEVLGKRVIDRGPHHAHLQLERLMPALRLRARRSAAATSGPSRRSLRSSTGWTGIRRRS